MMKVESCVIFTSIRLGRCLEWRTPGFRIGPSPVCNSDTDQDLHSRLLKLVCK